MIPRASLAFAIVVLGAAAGLAQDVAKPKTAPMVFADARDLINAGSLEVAADLLKDFLALNPAPQDYLDIEAKYGPTTFLKLRTIPRWYDEPKRDAAFKKDVLEKVVGGAIAANEALLQNPARIARFVRNLAGPPEEYAFAVQELKRSGDAVVPALVEALRVDADPQLRAGLLRAVGELGPETVPGLLAAAEGLKDEFQLLLLGALSRRADLLNLTARTDTNILPVLWRHASLSKTEPNPLREFSVAKLKELYAAAYDRRTPGAELTRFAEPLYNRQGKFQAIDSARNRVKYWSFDGTTQTVKATEVPVGWAEEAFGLKYLRWAIQWNSVYEPATDLALAFATDRAIERAKFGDLAKSDPNAFRLLAAAPAATLIRLLEKAMVENRTPLALGLVQALGDRAEPSAGNSEARPGGGTRPPVLVKALDYPDPRVQLAAALGLLRIPNAKHGANARVVEVLKRAVAPDAGAGTGKGKALVADPSLVRGDQVAALLRGIGYQVEIFGNGRALAQRIDRASDFDLVLIDRHIVQPTLSDLVPQLRAGVNAARRPMLIVASPDARAQLGLEALLARLAAVLAITETVDLEIPAIPAVDRRKSLDDIERERKAVVDQRDRRLRQLYDARLARLERLVESANLRQNDELQRRLALRLPQLTMAGLVAEYELTPTSAPKMVKDLEQLTELIRRQNDLDKSVENVDTANLIKLIQHLESVLTPELQKKFDVLRVKLDDDALALAKDRAVDSATEAALLLLARTFPGVSVIREPHSKIGFEDDVAAAMHDPAQRPRDPAEKAGAALAAVDALRSLADGSIPGYDVNPALDALRGALSNDALAPSAAVALSRMNGASAQTDLVKLAADGSRKPEIRSRGADAAVRSIQAFGKLAATEAIDAVAKATATEPLLASELAMLNAILADKPGALAEALKGYQPTPPTVEKPKEPAPMPKDEGEPKKDEKKDEGEPKKDK